MKGKQQNFGLDNYNRISKVNSSKSINVASKSERLSVDGSPELKHNLGLPNVDNKQDTTDAKTSMVSNLTSSLLKITNDACRNSNKDVALSGRIVQYLTVNIGQFFFEVCNSLVFCSCLMVFFTTT